MTRSTKTTDWTRVETREGVIFFMTEDVYEDGKLSQVRFTKEDNRTCTDAGNVYFRYSNKQAYKNAIKRAIKLTTITK